MKKDWKKIPEAVWEKLKDFWYWADDMRREFLIRQKKARKKRAHLREKLSPEDFQRYRRKEMMRSAVKAALGAIAVFLAIFLLWGMGRLIGMARTALFARPQPQTETESETQPSYPVKDITIGSTGCMLLHSPFIDSYPDAEGNYDFSSIYKFITPYYSAPDYMTCEFEGALGGDELGYSGYPNFLSPDIIIENIRDSGVDLQMLATNHIYDGWSYAFRRTMEVFEEKSISYTGVRKDEQQKHYYIADIGGITVGFVNYVYETTNMTGGTAKSLNGMIMETEDAPLLNSFNYDDLEPFYSEMKENIAAMRAEGAQFIIANMHWGTEYQLTEADYQREIAQKLCELGVDALIGGHPHCEQPIDMLESTDGRRMFCIYSEGNALSNQRIYLMDEMPTGHTEDGVMVTLTLHQDSSGNVTLKDVNLLPTWVYRFSEETGSKYYILPLDDVEHLETATGISGIYEEAKASYDRTMEVLGPGLEKVKGLL